MMDSTAVLERADSSADSAPAVPAVATSLRTEAAIVFVAAKLDSSARPEDSKTAWATVGREVRPPPRKKEREKTRRTCAGREQGKGCGGGEEREAHGGVKAGEREERYR